MPTKTEINNQPEKVLITWQATSRPFKKRHREVFLTSGAIVALISLILLFAKEFLLIAVILSVYFVFWVLNSVAPETTQHSITSQGIATGKKKYLWENLVRFWFDEKWGHQILNVETNKSFPRQLMMVLPENKANLEKIKAILNKNLKMDEPETTWLNGASQWLQKKVPLEKQETVFEQK